MLNKIFQRFCWFLILVLILLCYGIKAQFVSLTDKNEIELTLDYLEKAIQKTDTLQVFQMLGSQISIKGETVDPRSQFRSIFEKAGNRILSISPPSEAGNRKFWDLEITDLDIQFSADSTEALANCNLKLWAAKTDTPRTIKTTPEVFRFKKIGKGWQLTGFSNLVEFLWGEVNSIEKK